MKYPQRRSIQFACALLAMLTFAATRSPAQTFVNEARISSVAGSASFFRGGNLLALKKNDRLLAGDEIVTGATGRVVIGLTDGSQVIVYPGSRAVLRDFRGVGSWRDLLELSFGRVRARIQHAGGRPNPYRVNTPTASIAVRGTDFLVSVEAGGETRVTVFEGVVEVSSRLDPGRRSLVEAGRSVLVRAGGEISLALPGPGSELSATARLDFGKADPLNEIIGGLQVQYLDSLIGASPEPTAVRFVAFADAHFDSLDNPAYAGEFAKAEGRLYLVPSFSRARNSVAAALPASINVASTHLLDHTVSSQATYFAPIAASRWVLGGGAVTVRSDLQGLKIDNDTTSVFPSINVTQDSAILTTSSGALMLARKLGRGERTSLGLKLDYLHARGTATGVIAGVSEAFSFFLRLDPQVTSNRRSLSLGLAHDFSGGRKLGVVFRHGTSSTSYGELARQIDDGARDFIATNYGEEHHTRRFSELGARWRSPLTERWFYGAESLLRYEWGDSSGGVTNLLNGRKTFGRSHIRTARATLGLGLGYALRRHTFFGLDVTGGAYRSRNREADPAKPESVLRGRSNFVTVNASAQTDLWRGLFVNASYLKTFRWLRNNSDFIAPPNIRGSRFFSYAARDFVNAGAGWRLRPNLTLQYLFSTNFGNTTPSHTLLLRYDFSLNREK